MVTHPLALRSAKFKLKSGINQEPSYGLPPRLFRFKLELATAPR
jgi:hypothetical protein